MTIGPPPICYQCKHLIEMSDEARCDAFPVIPFEIISNQFDHREPHPDDGGVRFDPADSWNDVFAARYDKIFAMYEPEPEPDEEIDESELEPVKET